jgi:hypothetical protein
MSSADLMAQRYGAGRRGSRRLLIGAVSVVTVLALSWLVWIAWHHANPDIRGELSSYEVLSDHEVKVVIEVRRSTSESVECTVQAQADSHGIVADQQVTIPAGSDGDIQFSTTVPTERRATAVTVANCH